jgi:hypothetical protein
MSDYKTQIRETKAIQVYRGEDFIHTILKNGSGDRRLEFNVIYEDAYGGTEMKILSEEQLKNDPLLALTDDEFNQVKNLLGVQDKEEMLISELDDDYEA